jgi:hypothetical protein
MWYNRLMRYLLLSPLHRLLDRWFILLTCIGCKSGKSYTFPVQYVRSGNTLLIVSLNSRTWWKNLRGGAPVSLRTGNRDFIGRAEVMENPVAGLMCFLINAPKFARYFGVRLNTDGQPNTEDVARAAKDKVVVQIQVAA